MAEIGETVIQMKNVSKYYGKSAAVAEMSMRVNKGDIYALVGKNGAGKTTLLKLISGLTPASDGTIEIFGQSSEQHLGLARRHMGTMIETPGFFPYLTARENLEYYRLQRGNKDKGCVERALQFVGLEGTGRKKFKGFSLGMKQRLGLALAIMDNPEILILDEPINGLDPMGIKGFRSIILKMNREKKTTVLISSHILGELSQIATTYSFINRGRLVQHISAKDLKEKCRSFLCIVSDSADRTSEILKNNFQFKNIEVADKHTVHVNEKVDDPASAVKALVENGVMVSQVYQSGINLEQYFVNLVEGKENG